MWLLGIDPVRPFRSANVIVRQQPEPPPTSSHAKAKQASKPARSRIPQKSAVIEPAPTQEVSTAGPIDAGDQILASTQKETIAKTYGEPALSIRRVDRGHDLETLVYTRDRGKEVTVILLEDGKVPSAYSQSGITSALDTPRPRPDEHTAGLLAGPAAPQPASIAIAATAEAPNSSPQVLKKTLAEGPTAIAASRPSVPANTGTCWPKTFPTGSSSCARCGASSPHGSARTPSPRRIRSRHFRSCHGSPSCSQVLLPHGAACSRHAIIANPAASCDSRPARRRKTPRLHSGAPSPRATGR